MFTHLTDVLMQVYIDSWTFSMLFLPSSSTPSTILTAVKNDALSLVLLVDCKFRALATRCSFSYLIRPHVQAIFFFVDSFWKFVEEVVYQLTSVKKRAKIDQQAVATIHEGGRDEQQADTTTDGRGNQRCIREDACTETA